MRLFVAILLVFLNPTISSFVGEVEENIEDCAIAYLNDVCELELAADPNICSCRLCTEVCDPDGHLPDCESQRRFGRCWNISGNIPVVSSLPNETLVQRHKRNPQEVLQQSSDVKQEEKGTNINRKHDEGYSKSNNNPELPNNNGLKKTTLSKLKNTI